jgi:hypothetical protein
MMSIGLMAAAATLIRTSPSPTIGSGNSPNSKTSGPPKRRMKIAFISPILRCDAAPSAPVQTLGGFVGEKL